MREIEVPFAEWTPDLPDYRNPGATVATNVIPHAILPTGAVVYTDFEGLSNVSSNALDARCRGVFTARDKDGNVYTYAGDGAKIYSIADNVWANVSKSGNYTLATDDFWEFTQYGNQVVGVSFTTDTQVITLGGANFANLFTSTLKPKARRCATVRDFLFLGNTNDATDGNRPQRVWWTAQGDITDADPDAATQSDYQELDGPHGPVQKIVGGEYATIFMQKAVYRATYEGGATIFRFDEILSNRGTVEGNSVVKLGRVIFFLDSDGFYLFNGTDAIPIGKNKVDQTFWNDVDASFLSRITTAIDPDNELIAWAYPSTGNNGVPNRLMIYNWTTGMWSRVEVDLAYLFSDLTKGYTLDSLDSLIPDIDDTTVSSLDSALLTGGTPAFAAMTTDNKLAYFTGSALDAVIETGEIQPFNGRRTYVNEIRPYVDGSGATTTIQVGTRELHTGSNSYGSALSLDGTGKATTRTSGQFMRFRVNISGGFTDGQGVRIKAAPAGSRIAAAV